MQILGCDTEEIRESQSYWSGLHGYVVDDENKSMLMDQYIALTNKDVAGPSNLIRYPDGHDSDCIGHRNDQTVLSLMIYKYGFRQPFDLYKYNRYGDLQTMQVMLPDIYSQFDLSKVAIYSRFSKGNNFLFLKRRLTKGSRKSIRNLQNRQKYWKGVWMKAILSCDENPFYYDFWPLVKHVWKNHLGIDPFLIHISDEVGTDEDTKYIKPVPGVPIYLQAQLARIYFTQLFDDEICLVSDIDMIPVSKNFFNKDVILDNVKKRLLLPFKPRDKRIWTTSAVLLLWFWIHVQTIV